METSGFQRCVWRGCGTRDSSLIVSSAINRFTHSPVSILAGIARGGKGVAQWLEHKHRWWGQGREIRGWGGVGGGFWRGGGGACECVLGMEDAGVVVGVGAEEGEGSSGEHGFLVVAIECVQDRDRVINVVCLTRA